MKCTYKAMNNKLEVEFEATTQKDIFKNIANIQEVFEEEKCEACKSDNLRFVVRNVDGNEYYELWCRKCASKLAFGQHKTGGSLFPKRKEEDTKDKNTKQVVKGSRLPNNGWIKWEKKEVN